MATRSKRAGVDNVSVFWALLGCIALGIAVGFGSGSIVAGISSAIAGFAFMGYFNREIGRTGVDVP